MNLWARIKHAYIGSQDRDEWRHKAQTLQAEVVALWKQLPITKRDEGAWLLRKVSSLVEHPGYEQAKAIVGQLKDFAPGPGPVSWHVIQQKSMAYYAVAENMVRLSEAVIQLRESLPELRTWTDRDLYLMVMLAHRARKDFDAK